MNAADLSFARALIALGVPVFIARPAPAGFTGPNAHGYLLPTNWQHTRPDPTALDRWQPGHALCAVTGHALDVIDVDPRNGGSLEPLHATDALPTVYATVDTPSGGQHLYIAALGIGKAEPARGVDLQAGTPTGGRAFVFLPGTERLFEGGEVRSYRIASNSLATYGDGDHGPEAQDNLRALAKRKTPTNPAVAPVDPYATRWEQPVPSGQHDKAGAAYAAHLNATSRLTEAQAVLLLGHYAATWFQGVDPSYPFTDADYRRWWTGAQRKFGPADIAPDPAPRPALDPAAAVSLTDAEAVFRKWLGESYDVDTLRVCLAADAVRRLDGDPLWVMVVSGSGNAKTETVAAFAGTGATVAANLTGDAALLSATAKKDKAADATGGLLRTLGDSGTLVLKDFTSVLSMNRDRRAEVLGALREVYDGQWTRLVGAEGGRQLEWSGRVALIAACTTAWDSAHAVISTMGDRFAVIRADSATGRVAGGRQSLGNVGSEAQMRSELAAAVAGVIAGMQPPGSLTWDENETLLAAANLVTLARSAVETDYRGEIEWAHAPEMPTRFAKQLAQVMRGGLACGMERQQAMRLALRVATDSVPPRRLAALRAVGETPGLTTKGVSLAIQKPWTTTDRTLQALHAHGLVRTVDLDDDQGERGKGWRYELAEGVDLSVLDPFRERPNSPVDAFSENQNLSGHSRSALGSGTEQGRSDLPGPVAAVETDKFGNPLCGDCRGPLYTEQSIDRRRCDRCQAVAA